jgi:hypothetical protein
MTSSYRSAIINTRNNVSKCLASIELEVELDLKYKMELDVYGSILETEGRDVYLLRMRCRTQEAWVEPSI